MTGDRGVGDLETGRLDLAAVVLLDHRLVDHALGVGDQLRAGGSQLTEVLADRLDQRPHRIGSGLAALAAELVGGELRLVAVRLDQRAVDDPRPGLLRGIRTLRRRPLARPDRG